MPTHPPHRSARAPRPDRNISNLAAPALARTLAPALASALAAALAAGVFFTASGCSETPPPPPPPKGLAVHPDSVRTYTTRGQVVKLPIPGNPGSEFQVHHEAIPDFVNRQGQTVGMSAMIMKFPLAPGVTLEGLAIDDKIEITFHVTWQTGVPYQATKITRLPPDTPLNFGPPAAATAPAPGR